MKCRIISLLFSVLLLFSFMAGITSNALEEPKVQYTEHYAVYNIENDIYCAKKGEEESVPVAGNAKIMTACLAIENYRSGYDTLITVEDGWLDEVSGHTIGYRVGEEVTVDDLLATLIVSNANDSAYILANATAGSVEAFVAMMNEKAKALGMENTSFTNPVGIDEKNMYTNVKDVVKLCSYAYSQQKFTEYSGERNISVDATNYSNVRTLYNRNYFVSNYYNNEYLDSSVLGLNTGQSTSAGWCLSLIGRNSAGNTYVIVILGASDIPEDTTNTKKENTGMKIGAFEDAKILLDYAYNNFEYFTIADTSTMVCDVPVKLSSKVDHVILLPEKKVVAFLPKDTNIETAVTKEWELSSDVLKAPLKKGDAVGVLKVYINGELHSEVNLVAKNNIDRSNFLFILDLVLSFLLHPVTLIIGSGIIIVAIIIFIRKVISSSKKRHIVRYK